MKKEALRKKFILKRNGMSKKEVAEYSELITDKILNLDTIKKAKTILAYFPYGNEVSTKKIIDVCLNSGKTVCLPVCMKNDNLEAYQIKNYHEELIKNKNYKILEPDIGKCQKVDVNTLDVVLVPGVAFDKNKHRLGHGKGFYDRFLCRLSSNTVIIGVCYDWQITKNDLPIDDNDKPVNVVVTEIN